MASIFDLKTNVDELSSTNEGTSRMEYDQHPPTRDVVNNNFANGAIHFRFQTSGQKWWVPSRTYIRTRFQLTKGDVAETPVDIAQGVAPNMGLMANLFQSAEMRINDKVVSRVADFMPQVDAIETRLTKSRSWLDSVGEATNWWETDQGIRLQEVSSDGTLVKDTVAGDQTVTTLRAALGYDAAGGANNNTYEVKAQEIDLLRGTSANDLIVGAFAVGDYFSPRSGANDLEQYKILSIITDTTAQQTYQIQGTQTAQAATTGDFAKVVISPANAAASRRTGQFELTWCPPLSLFKIGHALPSGRYELVLNPQTSTSYQRRAIESILGVASQEPLLPGQTADITKFKLNVVNMYLYTATVEGPRADDITYLLDLEQTRCQSEKIDNENFQQKNFDVSPSTYALTVAYQDLRAGENTALSASKFKSYDASAIPTTAQEQRLSRFFINYAGQNLPAPDADPSFVTGNDYTTQRYAETQIYSGAFFDTGGAETIEEWHERGSYYYFSWPRDGTDRSTRVNVHQQFTATTDVTNMRCLLFDHSKQVARIRVQDGRVVDVQIEDS